MGFLRQGDCVIERLRHAFPRRFITCVNCCQRRFTLADGFANFAWVGVLAAGVVVGLLLRVFDTVSADLPLGISAPALVFVLQAAANTAILTTIMSHGAGVLVALTALMPPSVAATRWRRRREERSSGGETSSGTSATGIAPT